ncbi:histidine-type phosphatase [Sphingomonas sp. CGMCC 1.13654]|uniref:Histidine-type phosphatase n=1 Tax=Sphingomonas chungangi TaxID=2683589 RepID=A0A838L8L8_9SPHN|nr:histidine-type phosphatase [Sphingomonas chungangi]MBA2935025.1 histidine-type phosphatase [Sphingomonas chungangi]MVW54140.1 histidine-type phosphatase [Sphingomonas chungangi]
MRTIAHLAAAGILFAGAPFASSAHMPVPDGLIVDHVVMLMRHGVRPPTHEPAMPPGIASQAWPGWDVPPGWLTAHGALAITRMADWDGAELRHAGLLPATGCPAAGTVRVIADSDERTIATAETWLHAVAPACGLVSEHPPQGQHDPVFDGIPAMQSGYDPDRATEAARNAAGPGGVAALAIQAKPLIARLDAILCGGETGGCGIGGEPSAIVPATPGKAPKLTGALGEAASAAQTLLLEYAEGKPIAEVGWGRANAGDIAALSEFHAIEFRLLARPRYLAAAHLNAIIPLIEQGLSGPAIVTVISGHDANVADLGGLLAVDWHVPGLAADDPIPGGALVLTRLHDRNGRHYVRITYRSQALEQIRSARPLAADDPYEVALMPKGCSVPDHPGLCTPEQFTIALTAQP